MSKDMDVALGTTLDRMRGERGRYARWYLIGKPTTFWSWNLTFGQRGPFIYPVKSSIYSSSGFFMMTLSLFKAIHPLFALLCLAAIVMLLRELFCGHASTRRQIQKSISSLAVSPISPWLTWCLHLCRGIPFPCTLSLCCRAFAISKLIEIKNSRAETDVN